MTTPTFAKTHNLIAYLAKPTESEGFEQIIDFLNGSSVRYALTASPTIRTSCIKQFWSTAKVKTVNDEVRVQALIDEKRVTIKEYSIPHTLSTMVSTIICRATNQKFNFFKYILQSLVKNIEAGVPFYMFPSALVLKLPPGMNLAALWYQQSSVLPQTRSLTSSINHQLGDMSHHQDIYVNPSLTKKVFSNMEKVGIGFSGVITSLFKNMLIQAAKEVGQAQDDVSIPAKPSTSKPHKKHKSKKQQPITPKLPSLTPSPEHQLPSPLNDPIPDADKDSLTLQELVDLCIRLSKKVLDLESEVIDIKSSFTDRIQKLEDRVDQLEEENRALKEKFFKNTQVDTAAPVENMEESFKQGRMIADIDEDVEEAQAKAYNMDLQHAEKVLSMQDINEEEPAEVEEVLEVVKAAKLMTEVVTTAQPTTTFAQVPKPSASRRRRGVIIQDHEETSASVIMHSEAKKNMMIYLKNMDGFKIDLLKGMTYSEIRPIFEKHYNSIQAFLEKVEEEVTVQEESNKRQGKSLEQDIAKKLRIDKEEEELKTHLNIMANDDDNVYTEATPLASKDIAKKLRIDEEAEELKTHLKIMANDDDNVYTEATPLASKLVKERFETTQPKNFSDDILLNTLKIMFEKLNVEANVWRDQKGRYGLAKQMLDNVRLEVEEDVLRVAEVSKKTAE
nr:hypothetical protein [Tanacetum cinerariifolium]